MTVKPGFYLVRMIDGVEQQYHVIKEGLTKIGRANTQDIRCASLQVSRQHCVLDLVGGHVLIRDLKSCNGTYIEDKKIPALRTIALNDGDVIGLGVQTDFPTADFIFKLVIIGNNNVSKNGGEDMFLSEAEAMLKSLKRKSSEESASLLPLAKKPKDVSSTSNNLESIVVDSESNSFDKELLITDVVSLAKQEVNQIAEEDPLKLSNRNDIMQINLESDSDSELQIIEKKQKLGNDIEMKEANQSKESGNSLENNEKMQSPPEEIISVPDSYPHEENISVPDRVQPEEQHSFSINDEVIILSDSDNEDEKSTSQLFSHHSETPLKSLENNKPVIKNEVTENYEARMNEYDEDRDMDDSNYGMFEDHFIHCSQELPSNYKSVREIEYETTIKSKESISKENITSIKEIPPDKVEDKEDRNVSLSLESERVIKTNEPVTNEIISSIKELQLDKVEDKESKSDASSSKKDLESVFDKKEQRAQTNIPNSSESALALPDIEKSTVISKEKKKVIPKEAKRKSSDGTKTKSSTESKVEAKKETTKKPLDDKNQPNKKESSSKLILETSKSVTTRQKKGKSKELEVNKLTKIEDDEKSIKPILDQKVATASSRSESDLRVQLKKCSVTLTDIKKTKPTKLKNTVGKTNLKKTKNKEKESGKVTRQSDVEKIKKERREKLKMIALKAKSNAELKSKLSLDSTIDVRSKTGKGVETVKPDDKKSNTSIEMDTTKPLDTVKVCDRTKPIPVLEIKPPKTRSNTKTKTTNQKADNKMKSSTSEIKESDKHCNVSNNSSKENIITMDVDSKEIVQEKIETLEERLNRVKLFELNIVNNYNRNSLDLSTNNRINKKTKGVRFKEDLVEIKSFECEGLLTRKVSDKENRHRREIPPQTTLMQYSWRITLKTNYVLYDMCKWNVTWLEECKKIEGDPPVVKMQYLDVKDSYISYMDYWKTMYPLLMTELWNDIYNDLILQDNSYMPKRTFSGAVRSVSKNPPCVGQDNKKDGRRLISIDCVFVCCHDDCRKGIAPDEGDVGIMQVIIPGQKKQMYNTFIFVSSDMKTVSFHHSYDHFAKYVVTNMHKQDTGISNSSKEKGYLKNEQTKCLYGQLSFCDTPNKPIKEGYFIKLRILRNLYKNLRHFDSLTHLPNSPLMDYILNPKMIFRPKSHRQVSKQIACNFPLNQTQIDVIFDVVQNLISGKPSISLIHGPPGTGKSRVIASLVLQLLAQYSEKSKGKYGIRDKILLCAPSNAAIDSLVLRLLEIRQSLPNEKRFKLIRVGPPETIHKHVREISSYTLAAKDVGNNLDSDNLDLDLRLIIAEETSLSYAIDRSKDETARNRYTTDLAALQEKKRNLECVVKNRPGNSGQANFARAKLIREAETKVIQGAEIIATTLSSCCCRKIVDALGEHSCLKFSYCIVDEATQGIEPEVLLPLLHNISGMVLVGDPLQLAPTVLSVTGKTHNLGRSIFHRIWREWESSGNIDSRPFYKLNTQHRMHPEIAQFPNEQFYDNKLITPDFLNVQLPFAPYTVFSYASTQDADGESNTKEAELIVKLLCELYKAPEFKSLSIGIIVPYQRQKQIMERALNNLNGEIRYCKVNTVDSYQGQEKDVIIFSCVRTEGIGFLTDRQRVNVALTRARKCLIVVANFKSLQMDSTWKALLMNAKKRDVYREIPIENSENIKLVDLLLKSRDKRKKSS